MRYPMVSPNIATEKQENDNNLNKPMDLGVPYLQTNPEQKTMRVFVDVLHAWISYEAWPIMGAPKSWKLKMSNGTTLENQWFGVPLIQETPNSTEIKRLESSKSFKLRQDFAASAEKGAASTCAVKTLTF